VDEAEAVFCLRAQIIRRIKEVVFMRQVIVALNGPPREPPVRETLCASSRYGKKIKINAKHAEKQFFASLGKTNQLCVYLKSAAVKRRAGRLGRLRSEGTARRARGRFLQAVTSAFRTR